MHSAPHRANILDRSARYVGVGTVERGDLAYNTLDFVDAYSRSYGSTRVPAAALTMDRTMITNTMDVAMLESGDDQRFTTRHHGAVSASRLTFTGPSAANDAAYTWLRKTGRAAGRGVVIMQDAIDLSHATHLQLQLAAGSPRGRSLPVQVLLRRSFGGTVSLGTVQVSPRAGWVSLTLPAAARSFRTALVLRVGGSAVSSAGGRVRLAMYDVRAAV
jgi:hypothetical protein